MPGLGQAQEGSRWSEGVDLQWKIGRVGSVDPEESTVDVAGGTQGSYEGFEQGSGMKKAMYWGDQG